MVELLDANSTITYGCYSDECSSSEITNQYGNFDKLSAIPDGSVAVSNIEHFENRASTNIRAVGSFVQEIKRQNRIKMVLLIAKGRVEAIFN